MRHISSYLFHTIHKSVTQEHTDKSPFLVNKADTCTALRSKCFEKLVIYLIFSHKLPPVTNRIQHMNIS
jgi:hypothetical protein